MASSEEDVEYGDQAMCAAQDLDYDEFVIIDSDDENLAGYKGNGVVAEDMEENSVDMPDGSVGLVDLPLSPVSAADGGSLATDASEHLSTGDNKADGDTFHDALDSPHDLSPDGHKGEGISDGGQDVCGPCEGTEDAKPVVLVHVDAGDCDSVAADVTSFPDTEESMSLTVVTDYDGSQFSCDEDDHGNLITHSTQGQLLTVPPNTRHVRGGTSLSGRSSALVNCSDREMTALQEIGLCHAKTIIESAMAVLRKEAGESMAWDVNGLPLSDDAEYHHTACSESKEDVEQILSLLPMEKMSVPSQKNPVRSGTAVDLDDSFDASSVDVHDTNVNLLHTSPVPKEAPVSGTGGMDQPRVESPESTGEPVVEEVITISLQGPKGLELVSTKLELYSNIDGESEGSTPDVSISSDMISVEDIIVQSTRAVSSSSMSDMRLLLEDAELTECASPEAPVVLPLQVASDSELIVEEEPIESSHQEPSLSGVTPSHPIHSVPKSDSVSSCSSRGSHGDEVEEEVVVRLVHNKPPHSDECRDESSVVTSEGILAGDESSSDHEGDTNSSVDEDVIEESIVKTTSKKSAGYFSSPSAPNMDSNIWDTEGVSDGTSVGDDDVHRIRSAESESHSDNMCSDDDTSGFSVGEEPIQKSAVGQDQLESSHSGTFEHLSPPLSRSTSLSSGTSADESVVEEMVISFATSPPEKRHIDHGKTQHSPEPLTASADSANEGSDDGTSCTEGSEAEEEVIELPVSALYKPMTSATDISTTDDNGVLASSDVGDDCTVESPTITINQSQLVTTNNDGTYDGLRSSSSSCSSSSSRSSSRSNSVYSPVVEKHITRSANLSRDPFYPNVEPVSGNGDTVSEDHTKVAAADLQYSDASDEDAHGDSKQVFEDGLGHGGCCSDDEKEPIVEQVILKTSRAPKGSEIESSSNVWQLQMHDGASSDGKPVVGGSGLSNTQDDKERKMSESFRCQTEISLTHDMISDQVEYGFHLVPETMDISANSSLRVAGEASECSYDGETEATLSRIRTSEWLDSSLSSFLGPVTDEQHNEEGHPVDPQLLSQALESRELKDAVTRAVQEQFRRYLRQGRIEIPTGGHSQDGDMDRVDTGRQDNEKLESRLKILHKENRHLVNVDRSQKAKIQKLEKVVENLHNHVETLEKMIADYNCSSNVVTTHKLFSVASSAVPQPALEATPISSSAVESEKEARSVACQCDLLLDDIPGVEFTTSTPDSSFISNTSTLVNSPARSHPPLIRNFHLSPRGVKDRNLPPHTLIAPIHGKAELAGDEVDTASNRSKSPSKASAMLDKILDKMAGINKLPGGEADVAVSESNVSPPTQQPFGDHLGAETLEKWRYLATATISTHPPVLILQRSLAKALLENDALQTKLAEYDRDLGMKLEVMEAKLERCDGVNQTLVAEKHELQNRLDEALSQNYQGPIRDLEGQLSLVSSQKEDLEKEVESVTVELGQDREQLDILQRENAALNGENEQLKEQLASVQDERDFLKRELGRIEEAHNKTQEAIITLQSSLTEVNNEKSLLHSDISLLKDEYNHLKRGMDIIAKCFGVNPDLDSLQLNPQPPAVDADAAAGVTDPDCTSTDAEAVGETEQSQPVSTLPNQPTLDDLKHHVFGTLASTRPTPDLDLKTPVSRSSDSRSQGDSVIHENIMKQSELVLRTLLSGSDRGDGVDHLVHWEDVKKSIAESLSTESRPQTGKPDGSDKSTSQQTSAKDQEAEDPDNMDGDVLKKVLQTAESLQSQLGIKVNIVVDPEDDKSVTLRLSGTPDHPEMNIKPAAVSSTDKPGAKKSDSPVRTGEGDHDWWERKYQSDCKKIEDEYDDLKKQRLAMLVQAYTGKVYPTAATPQLTTQPSQLPPTPPPAQKDMSPVMRSPPPPVAPTKPISDQEKIQQILAKYNIVEPPRHNATSESLSPDGVDRDQLPATSYSSEAHQMLQESQVIKERLRSMREYLQKAETSRSRAGVRKPGSNCGTDSRREYSPSPSHNTSVSRLQASSPLTSHLYPSLKSTSETSPHRSSHTPLMQTDSSPRPLDKEHLVLQSEMDELNERLAELESAQSKSTALDAELLMLDAPVHQRQTESDDEDRLSSTSLLELAQEASSKEDPSKQFSAMKAYRSALRSRAKAGRPTSDSQASHSDRGRNDTGDMYPVREKSYTSYPRQYDSTQRREAGVEERDRYSTKSKALRSPSDLNRRTYSNHDGGRVNDSFSSSDRYSPDEGSRVVVKTNPVRRRAAYPRCDGMDDEQVAARRNGCTGEKDHIRFTPDLASRSLKSSYVSSVEDTAETGRSPTTDYSSHVAGARAGREPWSFGSKKKEVGFVDRENKKELPDTSSKVSSGKMSQEERSELLAKYSAMAKAYEDTRQKAAAAKKSSTDCIPQIRENLQQITAMEKQRGGGVEEATGLSQDDLVVLKTGDIIRRSNNSTPVPQPDSPHRVRQSPNSSMTEYRNSPTWEHYAHHTPESSKANHSAGDGSWQEPKRFFSTTLSAAHPTPTYKWREPTKSSLSANRDASPAVRDLPCELSHQTEKGNFDFRKGPPLSSEQREHVDELVSRYTLLWERSQRGVSYKIQATPTDRQLYGQHQNSCSGGGYRCVSTSKPTDLPESLRQAYVDDILLKYNKQWADRHSSDHNGAYDHNDEDDAVTVMSLDVPGIIRQYNEA